MPRNVVGILDEGVRELVEGRRILVRIAQELQRRLEPIEPIDDLRTAVLGEQSPERVDVETGGVVAPDLVAVALLPVADDVGVEAARPRDAALVEREAQTGKAARHSAEDQRPADGLAPRGEVADVVGDIVRGRRAAAEPDPGGVERGRHAELDTPLPQRGVVVLAVEAESVDPTRSPIAVVTGCRAEDEATHQHRPQPEVEHRVVELLDRLFRREGGHDGDGHEPVAAAGEDLGVEAIERSGQAPPEVAVVDRHHREPVRGVQD